MSDRYLERHRPSGNCISSGRHLLRTPPMTAVKKQLKFWDSDEKHKTPNPDADMTKKESPALGCSFSETANLDSLLKGMKGYQLTQNDLEFIEKMKEEKLLKNLQEDLEDSQKLLMKKRMALELANASRKMAQDELDKFPSCEDLTKWAKMVLRRTSPLTALDDLDIKSLLVIITTEDVQSFMKEKKQVVDQLKTATGEMKKKADEKRRQLEKQIACEKLKIQELMRKLADLKSQLSQQEANQPPEVQKEPEDLEEPQATKSKAKRQGSERKGVKLCEESTNGISTRRKHTNETKLKEKRKDILGTRPEEKQQKSASESKTLRSARGKPRNAQEGEVSEVSEQVGRERQKPAGSAPKTASTAESQKVNSEANQTTRAASTSRKKGAAEEAQPLSLRRSKRIANKKKLTVPLGAPV